jgi:hypothetical protein
VYDVRQPKLDHIWLLETYSLNRLYYKTRQIEEEFRSFKYTKRGSQFLCFGRVFEDRKEHLVGLDSSR